MLICRAKILFCFLVIDESLLLPKENINFPKLIRENLLLTSWMMLIFRHSRFLSNIFLPVLIFMLECIRAKPDSRRYVTPFTSITHHIHHRSCLNILELRFFFICSPKPPKYKKTFSETIIKRFNLLPNLSRLVTQFHDHEKISRRNKFVADYLNNFCSTRVQIRFFDDTK